MNVPHLAARSLRTLVPRAVRRQVSDVLSARTSVRVQRTLAALAAGGRDIVVGPWLGEVGFELLYWVPFLQWAVETAQLDPARLVIVSRGGTGVWYQHVSARYAEVFDHLSPDAFDAGNRARAAEVGEQKQVRATALERDIVARVATALNLDAPAVLHPELMFDLMGPYWWGHRQADWVDAHARFAPLTVPPPVGPGAPPPGYAAVKFYFNECFPATPANRARATAVVRSLAEQGPVVSLATGLRVDDHLAWEEEERMAVHGIRATLTPSTNLGVQTTTVAGARAWAGTYGGFAYLAPFCGVRSSAYFSNAAGFSPRHLALAERVFARFGTGLLRLN